MGRWAPSLCNITQVAQKQGLARVYVGSRGLTWKDEVERAMGIEPTAQAWEAWVLPLYDARAECLILVAFVQRINAAPCYAYATKF